MIPWQIVLFLNGLLCFAIGATVGFIFRRKVTLAFLVTTVLVLFIHLANDYIRSGFPRITLHGVAVSIYIAGVPLLLIGWLPAIGGAVLVMVGCRLVRRSRVRELGSRVNIEQ